MEDVYKMKASGGVITYYNRGTIQNCYVSGVIDGTQRGGNLGAIAGVNKESGRLEECYNQQIFRRDRVLLVESRLGIQVEKLKIAII